MMKNHTQKVKIYSKLNERRKKIIFQSLERFIFGAHTNRQNVRAFIFATIEIVENTRAMYCSNNTLKIIT